MNDIEIVRLTKEQYGVLDEGTADRMNSVLNIWFNNPMLSFAEIAEKAGVTRETFYHYRKNPVFCATYDEYCTRWFKQLKAKAIETMEIRLENGDFNAAKYILDGNDFSGTQKIKAETTGEIHINILDEKGDD